MGADVYEEEEELPWMRTTQILISGLSSWIDLGLVTSLLTKRHQL